jgi:diguanylate cyclase (GGDEF)-like protein
MLLRELSSRLNQAFHEPVTAKAPLRDYIPAPRMESASEAPDPRSILSSIGELIYDWNIVTDKLNWGANVAEVLGPIAKADISTGLAFAQRVTSRSVTSRYDSIFGSSAKDDGYGALYEAVYELTPDGGGDGDTIWVEDCGRWFQGSDGRPSRAQGVIRIVTERHEQERLLSIRSHFDPLTGVLNRMSLSDQLERLLAQDDGERKPFAILLAGVENLVALNRTYGYDIGDEVITALAGRLRSVLRAEDTIARYAGGKFALILETCDAKKAKTAAQRLLSAVAETAFKTSAGAIPLAVRIGAVIAPRDGHSAQILLQRAEEALDFARLHKAERFAIFESSLAREECRVRSLEISDGIVSALNERRVELAFQPIVHASSGVLAFHEALLRIRLADDKIVTPGAILPVAEKAGLVRLLDYRVLDIAVSHLVADPNLRISVNASMSTLHDPEWPELFKNALTIHPDIGERLILEITETTMIEDFDTARRLIALCKRYGVKTAMDDFGAGHTSFRNLRDLAFDLVKIDGVFVQNITHSEDDRFFVHTLIELAHHVGMKVVAEWVEDEESAQILRELGVDYLQGALYGQATAKYAAPIELTSRQPESALSLG